jgi:ubiquinone/menaquinone biosynthesis C-methylase UbiE
MKLEDRKLREIEHSDRRRPIVKAYEYKTDTKEGQQEATFIEQAREYEQHFSNMKFYSIAKSSFAYRDKLLFEGIRDAVVLDYCCGNGEIAIEMAKRGASRVIGIDISSVAIENARALSNVAGVGKICEFKVMDAEKTEFHDDTFDIIHEYGALHHLDLQAAYRELARILKPTGKLVCTEALRHNPLIHWYRRRTPHLRTKWEVEHILGLPEINSGLSFFDSLDLRTFHLASLAAVPFRKTFFFERIRSILDSVDSFLLSLPWVKKMAWVAVFELRKPIRKQQLVATGDR